MQQTWVELLPVAQIVLAALEGMGVVPIVDYIKKLFKKATGQKLPKELSFFLMFAVCFVLAALALVVQQVLVPESFETVHLVTTFVTVFSVAKVRYDMARKKEYKPVRR